MKESKNKNKGLILNYSLALVLPVALIILWQISYDNKIIPPSQSSSPLVILKTLINLINHSSLLDNLLLSMARLLTGVFIGAIFGIIVGILTSTKIVFNKIFAPSIQFFSGIPIIIWIPFWIMIFGLGESFKIGMVSILTFFLVYGSTYQSIISIDKSFLELSSLYQKKFIEMIKQIYLPYSFYSILGSIRLSLMIGWIVLFFVEYSISFEGKEGLGWFIANARGVGKVDDEFVGLICLGFTAFICDIVINYFQKRSIRWKK